MQVKKAVIPAAGHGTRFSPYTRYMPKEMLLILDKPVIYYPVNEAVQAGLDEIAIIIRSGKESIREYLVKETLEKEFAHADRLPHIDFIMQEKPAGLGDAVRCAKEFVGGEPFVLLLGDTIFTSKSNQLLASQLIHANDGGKKTLLGVEKVSREKVVDFGIVKVRESAGRLLRVTDAVEKPTPADAPSDLALIGTNLFQPGIFNYLEKIEPGLKGEYQLTDAIKLMCKESEVYAYIAEGKRYDIGTMDRWIDAFLDFAKNDEKYSNRFKA